jgi:hypothetical protein
LSCQGYSLILSHCKCWKTTSNKCTIKIETKMFSITQKTKFHPCYIFEHRQRKVILKLSKIHSNIFSNTTCNKQVLSTFGMEISLSWWCILKHNLSHWILYEDCISGFVWEDFREVGKGKTILQIENYWHIMVELNALKSLE